jgi:hypothetical protein
MAEISNPLLALLQERGLIDDMQFEEVSQELQRSGAPVIQVLQDFGFLDMGTILQVMADHLHTEVVEIRDQDLTPESSAHFRPLPPGCTSAFPVAVFDGTVRWRWRIR